MNILEELWYGNISPIDQSGICTEEYKEMLDVCIRCHKKLETTLNTEEKAALEKLQDSWSAIHMYAECGAFVSGFKLAVQMMTASLGGA